MAENRRYLPNQQLDLGQILSEAQNRWLRPNEVCEILRNYQRFSITPDPPYKPSGGSLFLFDRKALRYFRKDGHSWRKKKDGKTVREAHEKLKAGSVDVLHCYYAHGEDNENFQRRCYWMLDTQLEHIVLVHYREVKEGNRSGVSRLLNADLGTLSGSAQTCPAPSSALVDSTGITVQASYASSPSTAEWNGHARSSEFEDVDSGDDPGTSSLAEGISYSRSQNPSLHTHDVAGKSILRCRFSTLSRNSHDAGFSGGSFSHDVSPSLWSENHSSSRNTSYMHEQKTSFNQPNGAENMTRLTEATLETCSLLRDDLASADMVFPDAHFQTLRRGSERQVQLQEHQNDKNGHADYFTSDNCALGGAAHMFHLSQDHDYLSHPQIQNKFGSCLLDTDNDLSVGFGKTTLENDSYNEAGELKKLDSFGRWMNKEIGGDCDDSLMASDSGNYWNTLDTQNDDKEVSSLSRHMQLDMDSLGPSLSHDQLFSICDYSPDWAYSGVETKVLISGTFLGDSKRLSGTKWCCMFGEVEVPAEVITDSVLRCQAPVHAVGRVPFYVTCSNRLACSEVREFEYRKKSSEQTLPSAVKSEPGDEMCLQIRFAKMLFLGLDRKLLDCSIENCDKCNLKSDIFSLASDDEKEWGEIEKASIAFEGNRKDPRNALIQKLLKDRLYEWLASKVHEGAKGPHILDDKGQGVIHLAASLGYGWALDPIVAAGISPNFRDAHGRTGLHWAAYFGREETVVALVRLGAAPGAVDDPTSKFPGGRTAADLASSRGHKGIAGYLAEADLTSHLSSLTLNESVMDSVAATIAAEKAIETVEEQSIPPDRSTEGQVSLKGSLAAVRKSAQAAALIQAAFRARSFRHRELTKSKDESSEISADIVTVASFSNRMQKMNHFTDYLHSAAVKIQQKYRGWKGRKEFLKIRNRIVKIQAHVRGHQVRKQYKKVIWSVSIVEKAILRWRRKGAGLRGFRADKAIGNTQPGIAKTDEYDFLRVGRKQKVAGVEKALARVQSMVRYPEARDQYMRLVKNFEKSKMEGEGSSTMLQAQSLEKGKVDEDILALAPMTD
ncbi:IQ motif [Macleaya cordata]|uniref:IQ motif n=1 Tax=Macleaya cordata TaxID=56857 RepID=A0A200R1X8_MACCD|nr:IQ motif [Macleaya cordata]